MNNTQRGKEDQVVGQFVFDLGISWGRVSGREGVGGCLMSVADLCPLKCVTTHQGRRDYSTTSWWLQEMWRQAERFYWCCGCWWRTQQWASWTKAESSISSQYRTPCFHPGFAFLRACERPKKSISQSLNMSLIYQVLSRSKHWNCDHFSRPDASFLAVEMQKNSSRAGTGSEQAPGLPRFKTCNSAPTLCELGL